MKAILVIDVPKSCEDCPCTDYQKCYATDTELDIQWSFKRPAWCPLKPMPEKKEEGYPNDDYTIGKADGWNACLYEITGETE